MDYEYGGHCLCGMMHTLCLLRDEGEGWSIKCDCGRFVPLKKTGRVEAAQQTWTKVKITSITIGTAEP